MRVPSGLLLSLLASSGVRLTAASTPVEGNVYRKGDDVPLQANSLTSVHTQISKDYYAKPLPFCHPAAGLEEERLTFGQRLAGNKIRNTPYRIKMLQEVRCEKLCEDSVSVSSAGAEELRFLIRNGYHHNWLLDGLPSANFEILYNGGFPIGFRDKNKEERVPAKYGNVLKRYNGGFPIGFWDKGKEGEGGHSRIFNHVKIQVEYTRLEKDGYRIWSFGVQPISVSHNHTPGSTSTSTQELTCSGEDQYMPTYQIVKADEPIVYSYDVVWTEHYSDNDPSRGSRWSVYLTEDNIVPDMVHIYSIVNSVIVVILLTAIVTCILIKNLRRDVASNRGRSHLDLDGNNDDEGKGWLALHGDVFRPPRSNTLLFCVFVGTGHQLALTALLVLLLAVHGSVSMAHPGSLVNAVLVVSALCSGVAGYTSSRLLRAFGKKNWTQCAAVTIGLFPGTVCVTLLALSLLARMTTHTTMLPISTLLTAATVWFLVATPAVWMASKFGYHQAKVMEFPTKTNTAVRNIPAIKFNSGWRGCVLEVLCVASTGVSPYCSAAKVPWFSVLYGGVVPFATIYVELFFTMKNLFMYQSYCTFGFATIVYLMAMTTCAEVTTLMVYYRLNRENHQWWWPAFLCSGSIGFSIFLYSCFWMEKLELSFAYGSLSHGLYLGKMFLIAFGAFLLFGSVGTIASLIFVCKLYSVVGSRGEGAYVELQDNDDVPDERLGATVPTLQTSLIEPSRGNANS